MSASLLAIDTSSAFCSVALIHEDAIYAEHAMTEQSHSEHILPMVRRVLEQAQTDLQSLDAFVVGIGPGGFTGVRLGVAVVQGLAYATGKKVVALSSLLALAQAARDADGQAPELTVLVANDARMKQVYWAAYRLRLDGSFDVLNSPSLGDLNDITDFATKYDLSNAQLAGNAWTVFEDFQSWANAHQLSRASIDNSAPNAANLLSIAQLDFAAGRVLAPHDVAPLYVRDKIAQTIAERAAAKAI